MELSRNIAIIVISKRQRL